MVAAAGLTCRVQTDELSGDLTNRLARPSLRGRPIRTTETVQRRCLASDVARYLIKLISWHVQSIPRLPALGRRVFDDQVLAGCIGNRTLHHLDVSPNTMLFMDDVVTRLQRERINCLSTSGRQSTSITSGGPLPDQIRLSDDRHLSAGQAEASVEISGDNRDHGRFGSSINCVNDAHAKTLPAKGFSESICSSVASCHDNHRPRRAEPVSNIGKCSLGLTAVAVCDPDVQLNHVNINRLEGVTVLGNLGAKG